MFEETFGFIADPIFGDNGKGILTVLKNNPFEVKRIFWITDMEPGITRGGHAHKKLRQSIFLLNGQCRARLRRPNGKFQNFDLERPYVGLYLPPLTWLELKEFSRDTVILIFEDDLYKPEDYISDEMEFDTYANSIQ